MLHILVLLLQLLDNVEVLLRDIIVVLFHFTEGVLVVHHQIIDVLVLALFDLVDFDLHPQGELALQISHLGIILLDQGFLVLLELLLKDLDVLLVLVGFGLNLADIGLIVPLVILLPVLLAAAIIFLRHLVMVILVGHDFRALNFDIADVFLVLILMVLHLLQVRNDKRVVSLLLTLHLCVKVFDF